MNKNFHAEFKQCPCCGSGQRFFEQLANELKDAGLARPGWHMFFDMRQGVVVDHDRSVLLPVGAEVPAFGIATDICMNCGCIYAVDLTRMQGKIEAPIQRLPPRPPKSPRFSTS